MTDLEWLYSLAAPFFIGFLAVYLFWNLTSAIEAFHEYSFHQRTLPDREAAFFWPHVTASLSPKLSDGSRNDAGVHPLSPVVALKPPPSSLVANGHGDALRGPVSVLHDRWVAEYAGSPLPPPADLRIAVDAP